MKNLEKLRNQIDQIDGQIIILLQKRFDFVKNIGMIKKEKNLPILDEKRKEEMLAIKKSFAKKINISGKFIAKIFSIIHDYSLKIQKEIER